MWKGCGRALGSALTLVRPVVLTCKAEQLELQPGSLGQRPPPAQCTAPPPSAPALLGGSPETGHLGGKVGGPI